MRMEIKGQTSEHGWEKVNDRTEVDGCAWGEVDVDVDDWPHHTFSS